MSAEGCAASGRRTAAIERGYVEVVRLLDSEAGLVGLRLSSDRVQKSHVDLKEADHVRFV